MRPYRRFRARTADESVDRAVGEHDRGVAGFRAGGSFGQDDAGYHVGDAVAAKLVVTRREAEGFRRDAHSMAMSVRNGRPWIARHTCAGVSGMSAWRTP